MAEIIPTNRSSGPTTEEAFIADRQHFWALFTRFATISTIVAVIVLVLMAVFLL